MNRQTIIMIKKRPCCHAFAAAILLVTCFPPLAPGREQDTDNPSLRARPQWVWQNPLPQGNDLFGLSFSDANNGTAVGLSGTIVRTTDGGRHWVIQPSGTIEWLYGVSFTDANTGTVVGANGTILRTTNAGSTWVSQASGTTNALFAVSFSDGS